MQWLLVLEKSLPDIFGSFMVLLVSSSERVKLPVAHSFSKGMGVLQFLICFLFSFLFISHRVKKKDILSSLRLLHALITAHCYLKINWRVFIYMYDKNQSNCAKMSIAHQGTICATVPSEYIDLYMKNC